MIICFAGTPGSGKSYDTVRKILDNLKLGRVVYTNVEGLDDPVCREFIKVYTGLDDYEIETRLIFLPVDKMLRFWESEKVTKNAGTEFENTTDELICQKGSMIVIDEVHKLFNCRNWQSKENKEFADWASTHRHDGYDVVLVTQDLDKVEKQVRSLVEWTYVYKKVNFLGSLFANSYLVYSYTGDDASGKPLATEKRMYKPQVFRCYKSYTSKDMKEMGIMKHTNVLKHPVFYAIPLVFLAFLYLFLNKSSFASGDIFGSKKMLNKPGLNQAIKPPQGPTGGVAYVPVGSPAPVPASVSSSPVPAPLPPAALPPAAAPVHLPPLPVPGAYASQDPGWQIVGRIGDDITLQKGTKLLIVADGSKIGACRVQYPSITCKE